MRRPPGRPTSRAATGPRAGAGIAALLALLALGHGPPPAAQSKHGGEANVEALTIELRLPRDRVSAFDSIDAEILFHNLGKGELKLAMIDGPGAILFFDFLVVGDHGLTHLTRNGEGWGDPSVKPVTMVRLRPGASHRVALDGALSLRGLDVGAHPDQRYTIQAIYRDHSYGHSPTYDEYGKDDPAVWKGIAISAPVAIEQAGPESGPPPG